jgi:hypothetical protein
MAGRRICPRASNGCSVPIAVVVFLAVVGLIWIAAPRADSGDWPAAGFPDPNSPDPPRARPNLSLFCGGQSFIDDDMEQIYGTIPAFGVRLALPVDERSSFFLDVSYGFDSGDPYYSVEGFSAGSRARLKTVPIEFGMRSNVLKRSPHKFHLGFALQYVWVSEKIPGAYSPEDSEAPAFSGWGWGWKVLLGPEWRFSEGRLGLGAEFSWSMGGVYVSSGSQERPVELSGPLLRGYLTVDL